jgi:pimeloyl-ACP methyl ester carboxylesterase
MVNSLPTRILLLCLVILSAAGCATTRPDLKRLYEHESRRAFYHPVVVIHGFGGARLRTRDTRVELWPPGLSEVLSRETYELALPVDPVTLKNLPSSIEAYALFDQLGGIDFYAGLLTTLSRPGGYQHTTPGTPVQSNERRFYTFTYDWRQDIVTTVRHLDRLITQIRLDYGQPDLKVDIVAHSMGGLITRYYARYGTRDVLDSDTFAIGNEGAARIRKVVMMGTPNLGAVNVVHTYISGFGIGSLGLPTEVLTTLPAVYQLFPHPLVPWLIDIDGNRVSANLYDAETWKRYQWGIYDPQVSHRVVEQADDPAQGKARLELLKRFFVAQLERSKRLSWALSVPAPATPLDYIIFGGDCKLTPARILVEKTGNEYSTHLFPDRIIRPRDNVDYTRLMLQPGDGRVTKPSLLSRESLDPTATRDPNITLPLRYSIMFCESHGNLTSNIHFQDNLLNILLTAD